MHVLWVAVGGFWGAMARYFVSQSMAKRFPKGIPYGTLSVNLIGSFCLGWLLGSVGHEGWIAGAGTGFLGAFTTFSTLYAELVQMIMKQQWVRFLLYTVITYSLGIGLAYLGYLIGTT
ncbi:fluoride efflux transporter CrcB [Marinicrinis sediminis]|uniref:Fluoride-specific ion channel FluC n=1 Tax=Marinicrinis sediminis TaxID=1652465 RepID=A0ABW5R5I8_9BACL